MCALACGSAELGLRVVRGGRGALPVYVAGDPPTLTPDAHVVGLLGDRRYVVDTDVRGFRVPSAPAGAVLLGDSLAFGLGLDGPDTLAARCTARGHPMINAAAPIYTAIDALDRGRAFPPDAPFLLVLNPWDDGLTPLSTRTVVVDGWLLRTDSPRWVRGLFASPLAGSYLVQDVGHIVALARARPDPEVGFAVVGDHVRSFVADHPHTRVVWGGYPAPSLPDGRVVEDLRRDLGYSAETLLLTDAWIDGDLHWSAAGVEQVAAQLCP